MMLLDSLCSCEVLKTGNMRLCDHPIDKLEISLGPECLYNLWGWLSLQDISMESRCLPVPQWLVIVQEEQVAKFHWC